MAGKSRIRRLRAPLFVCVVMSGLLLVTSAGTAQLPVFTPTPAPTKPPPEPTLTPPPATPTPSANPVPSDVPVPGAPSPVPTVTKKPAPTQIGTEDPDELVDELPEGLEDFVVPSFPRTRPQNTVRLVNLLRPLTKLGMPLDQALVEGMGRFPVAGLANYFDDWQNPRFTPKPHLHEGLDIFADFGTPIRTPDRGVITQMSTHGSGGIAVWMRGTGGVSYYFAHLLEWAEGIRVGQRVDIGTVIGFVGDTGNAKGGTPHLHFEIHPGGGAAIPPKPTVDTWLDEAEERAPKFVAARRADVSAKRRSLGSAAVGATAPNKEIEASMLLTLLDPVGGSVGLLPSLELASSRGTGAVSDRLFSELLRARVSGGLFIPSDRLHIHD